MLTTVMNRYLQGCSYHLMTRVSTLMMSRLKDELRVAGFDNVKPAYLSILICLWEKEKTDMMVAKFGYVEGMKMFELGKSAGLESSTMTGLIDRMERDGLVVRVSDTGDRRALRVCLTDEGSILQKPLKGVLNLALEKMIVGIAGKDTEVFKQVLKRILVSL